jgi:antitoxin component of RelBE/YafQ-DinJ toxin-antitoxin module
MGQNTPRVADPFSTTFVESLQKAIADEGAAINAAQQVSQESAAENAELGTQLERDLSTLIGVKQTINDKVAQEFEVLRAGREESWNRQQALVNQRQRVSQMNPLVQAIKGMFDPNFSRSALDTELGVEKALDAESVRIFQERTQSAKYLAELAASSYEDKARLAELVQRNNGLDLQAAMQWISLAGAETNNLLEMLDADNKIERAKQTRIENQLSNMSAGQVSQALKVAAQSPSGTALVNGVPIPLGALQDQEAVIRKRGLTLKQLDLATQLADKELEDFAKEELLSTLTPPELRKILENGGVYEGRQFDIVEINKRLQAFNEAAVGVAEDASMETMENTSLKFIQQTIQGGNRAVVGRIEQLMGSVPGELREFLGQQLPMTLRSYASAGEAAKKRGVGEQFFATNFATLQTLATQRNKIIESVVSKWAGGNTDLQALGNAWMTGQKIDPGVATRALIHFARNGLPAGAGFTGDAAQMVRIAREVINNESQAAQSTGGNESIESIISRQSGGSKAEREQQLASKISSAVQGFARVTIADGANMLIPQIAAEKKLPFKAVTPQQWVQVMRDGDRQGLQATAGELNGMNADTFARMLREGPEGKIWKDVSSGLQGELKNFARWESKLASNQMQAIYALVDSRFSRPGFNASEALRDVVSQPEYIARVRSGVENMGAASLGGFLFGALTGTGEVMSDISGQQDLWVRSYSAYSGAKRQAQINAVRDRAGDPFTRARYIMTGGDVSDDTVDIVIGELNRRFSQQAMRPAVMGPAGVGVTPTTNNMQLNRRIDDFILNGKTGDPTVDAALKAVRPHYKKLAGPMTQSFQRNSGGQ